MSSESFVTLATTDAYGLGAAVLAQSIRNVGTTRNLVVLISNDLSDLIRKTLETNFDEVIVVDQLNSNDVEHLRLLNRPELGITFTKINCWLLEQYSKCVFLDADCVVLRPIDDLFEREELSASPDAGWPDCFNSGVFVYRPSKDTFHNLFAFASQQNASFDGGDQGLLNSYFSNWRTSDISRHLPFTYNVTANAFYSYLPAVTRFRNDIHIVHFAGAVKPWQLTYNSQNEQLAGNLGGQNAIQRELFLSWWRIMSQQVWPMINRLNQKSNLAESNNEQTEYSFSSNGSFSSVNVSSTNGIEVGSVQHRRLWESGQVDYFGRDSFSNIQQQLQKNIQSNANQHFHPSQQKQSIEQQKPTSILKTSSKQTTENVPTLPLATLSLNQSTLPLTKSTKSTERLLLTSDQNNLSHHQFKQPSTQLTNPIPTSLNASKEVQSHNGRSTSTDEYLLKEPTNLFQSSTKESKVLLQQNPIHLTQTVSSSATKTTLVQQNGQKLTENLHSPSPKNSTADHQTNWTVKSTIVTSFTPGVGQLTGPTVLSKVVSETSSSGSTTPIADSTTILSPISVKGNVSSLPSVGPSASNVKRVKE